MSIVVVGAEVAVEGAEVVAESGMASVVVIVVAGKPAISSNTLRMVVLVAIAAVVV